ncbi:DEAD/DEAH box helicase [Paenibacillus sp. P96]|uniref:DEAD/DEAH box helicase n=1 Tax=Paenibacillus zeirhizosphaerae TaxID=2987519 RepID=A0ABT9FUP8_9BACL|nr:DEAD/DEAH box helicase [Paenibacillus sp. P96]MDP4098466.1 DEAD/DEAH box helicase [Paenibacillus sp. P96]
MKSNFEALGVSGALAAKLAEHGIEEPSPVQQEAIPLVLEGRDVIARSQTGTGKTLAYLLPILQSINPELKATQKLVLAPSQELAMQIVREAQRYMEDEVGVLGLIGGAAVKRQIEKLREHPRLVVGTPGRVRELIALKKLKMHNISTIVVDEVDQIFQLGDAGEVNRIIDSAMRDRQLVFLSATINGDIRAMAGREMKNPAEVGIEPERVTAAGLEHYYFVCEERDKVDTLRRIVRQYNPRKAIVFVNVTDTIGELEAKLNHLGLKTAALYGDADKVTRATVLSQFRADKLKLLVATDVAARGLDIEGLDMVIHFDPATDSEHYIHRAGRTGRMGRQGTVISIVTERERFIVRKFSRDIGEEIHERILRNGMVAEPGSASVRRPAPAKRKPEAARPAAPAADKGMKEASRPAAAAADSGIKQARPAARKGGQAQNGTKSKSERERDRKNKGAPRWLKEKGRQPE